MIVTQLATGVKVRVNLGRQEWSPGREQEAMVAKDVGGLVSYCKSSNKAMRLSPVTGFNISSDIARIPTVPT